MRVLVIKLTSMGDVIHILPALTDAQKAIPEIEFDFVVEESFQEIPGWHPAVREVIPVATRRWRKNLIASRRQIMSAIKRLREQRYDVIIDAQGLLKSAFIASLVKGQRHGYNAQSIREPLASRLYQHTHSVDQSLHAIARVRRLFAQSLGYSYSPEQQSGSEKELDYGLVQNNIVVKKDDVLKKENPYIIFLHGTTWKAKEWPTENWCALAEKVSKTHKVLLPWGNDIEYRRALTIAENISEVEVLPKLKLSSLAHLIVDATAIVAVDTGLGHLSAALSKPTLSIYGPTDTKLIGALGDNQVHIRATDTPNWRGIKKNEAFDYGKVSVDIVYEQLQKICS